MFTILDVPKILQAWLDDLRGGQPFSANCPQAWRQWVATGNYDALRAQLALNYCAEDAQTPCRGLGLGGSSLPLAGDGVFDWR